MYQIGQFVYLKKDLENSYTPVVITNITKKNIHVEDGNRRTRHISKDICEEYLLINVEGDWEKTKEPNIEDGKKKFFQLAAIANGLAQGM
jgi:DNA helicase TIP49 (TBP-interacting protein)